MFMGEKTHTATRRFSDSAGSTPGPKRKKKRVKFNTERERETSGEETSGLSRAASGGEGDESDE